MESVILQAWLDVLDGAPIRVLSMLVKKKKSMAQLVEQMDMM